MRQVSKEEFYRTIYDRKLDVHPRIVNDRWPYTSDWTFHRKPGSPLFGRSIGEIDGSHTYFLAEHQA